MVFLLCAGGGLAGAHRTSETSNETKAWSFTFNGVHLWCSLAGVNKREQCPLLFQPLGIFSLTDVKRMRGREEG